MTPDYLAQFPKTRMRRAGWLFFSLPFVVMFVTGGFIHGWHDTLITTGAIGLGVLGATSLIYGVMLLTLAEHGHD